MAHPEHSHETYTAVQWRGCLNTALLVRLVAYGQIHELYQVLKHFCCRLMLADKQGLAVGWGVWYLSEEQVCIVLGLAQLSNFNGRALWHFVLDFC